ncbi:hypothetical protein [Fictibacillus sp. NRS-1165]|uniref:hypothetical protein n=1 Tax=Fictibacillus sp. NRS-1165 TaxID=3144463 RepID=UPI003D216D30
MPDNNQQAKIAEDETCLMDFEGSAPFIRVTPGTNDSAAIQDALTAAGGKSWVILEGTYTLNAPITAGSAKILSKNAILNVTHTGQALTFTGTLKTNALAAAGGYTQGRNYLLMRSTEGIAAGDIVRFISTTELYHPSRNYYYKGSSVIVSKVASDRIYFAERLPYSITSVNTVEVYSPANVRLEGKLNLINTQAAVPANSMGMKLERCVHSYIEGVFVDGFDTNITPRYCVGVTFKECETGRAWYSGTGTSYGFCTMSSNNVIYDTCKTRTGRHGHAGGGYEPIDMIYFKNCSFYAEPEGAQYSFDLHDNTIRSTFENCDFDSFNVIGNVIMRNCTAYHLEKTASSFKSGDDYEKCSYVFDTLKLPNGGQLSLTGYAQSGGTWTMNKISSITLRNIHSKASVQFNLRAADYHTSMPMQYIENVIVENCTNVAVLMKDTIKNLLIQNYQYLRDAVYLYQYPGAGQIQSVTVQNAYLAARYTGICLRNFKRATFANCTDFNGGYAAPRGVIHSEDAHVTFINCDFTHYTEGFQLTLGTKGVYTLIDSVAGFYGTPAGVALHLQVPILTGTAPPASIPQQIGQEYLDTSSKKLYKAFGTASSTDWVVQN